MLKIKTACTDNVSLDNPKHETLLEERTPAIDSLFSLIENGLFFDEYWEKKSLLIKSSYNHVDEKSLDDLLKILTDNDVLRRDLRVIHKSNVVPFEEFSDNGVANAKHINSLVLDKATFVYRYFERFDKDVNTKVEQLEDKLNNRLLSTVRANCYYTPAHSTGFRPHWDSHDIIVYQAAGSKRWSLWNSPVELPNKYQNFSDYSYTPTEENQLVLNAGDVLFLPRGCIHSAATSDSDSIHYSFGVRAVDFGDVLLKLTKQLTYADTRFRKTVDLRSLQSIEVIKQNFAELVQNERYMPLLSLATRELVGKRKSSPKNRTNESVISKDSQLKRTGVKAHIVKEQQDFVLFVDGEISTVPRNVKDIVCELISKQIIVPKDIDQPTDVVLKLCEKLVEQGLFEFSD